MKKTIENHSFEMIYFCNLCDTKIKKNSKYNLFKSVTYTWFENSFKRRFSFSNPNLDENDEILRKNVINHTKKNEDFEILMFNKIISYYKTC